MGNLLDDFGDLMTNDRRTVRAGSVRLGYASKQAELSVNLETHATVLKRP